jgi:hypothetical protein
VPLDTTPRTVPIPTLLPDLDPPVILGTAALARQAFAGTQLSTLLDIVRQASKDPAGIAFDQGLAMQLSFRREAGLVLQAAALARSELYRVGATGQGRPRILAFCAPGDLMTNTPLEFLAEGVGARLDLAFITSERPLPSCLPDHDVAFCAVSEMAPDVLARLAPWLSAWPRPVLNRPPAAARLTREATARLLADLDGVLVPEADCLDRAALAATPDDWFPFLVRPAGTHAGMGLTLVRSRQSLDRAMRALGAARYNRTRFVDYRSQDGLYRKYRVALVSGRPVICHMAISDRWMVHYLNAGMADRAERRAEEARVMESFETGFGRLHAEAFAAIAERLELDWVVVDCGETADGRLLFFEADVAAIVHDMDPPTLYPYKQTSMARVYDAFRALVAGSS